jgi:uncharacterized membrane protein
VNAKSTVRILFLISVSAYPFFVYFGLQFFPPSFFAIALAVLLALRYGVLTPSERQVLLPCLAAFFGYAITAALLKSAHMLLFYPVLVNMCLFIVFANSIRHAEPLLLRIVRGRGAPISEHGPKYLFWLTVIWSGVFAINAAIALWTTTQSMQIWVLYNGLIAYIIVAVLIGIEWLFRVYYKRRVGVDSH